MANSKAGERNRQGWQSERINMRRNVGERDLGMREEGEDFRDQPLCCKDI